MRKEPGFLYSDTAAPVFLAAIIACVMAASPFAGNAAFAQMQDDIAILETDLGTIVIEFFPDDAPNHVSNFLGLAESGFYDGTLFHRIIPGFMIQGGDPNTIDGDPSTWGTGGPQDTVNAEFNNIEHDRGIVSMARSQDPNSAGSQFFIVHQDSNFLDGQYTAFGRIITESSFETLDKIAGVPTGFQDRPVDAEQVRIHSIRVAERSEASDVLELLPPERTTAQIQAPPAPSEQNFTSADLGVSFIAPPGWLIQEPGRTNPDAPAVVAVGQRYPDGSIPQVYMYVSDADGKTLEEIVNARVAEIRSLVSEDDFATLTQEPTAVAEFPAHQLEVIETITIDNNTTPVKLTEILVYGDGGYYYRLAYAHTPANFDDALPHFQRMLETFKVTGPPVAQLPSTTSAPTTEDPSQESDVQNTDDPVEDAQQQQEQQLTGAMSSDTGDGGGSCLIATAAFGSELAPQIQTLRELRDNTIIPTQSGAAFMSGFNTVYYSFSPHVADMQREHPVFREAVKLFITPMISSLSIMNVAEINSESDVVLLGSAVILFNVGLYVVAPTVALFVAVRIRAKRQKNYCTY